MHSADLHAQQGVSSNLQQRQEQLADHRQESNSMSTHPAPLLLHQLPSSALAAIASHLDLAEKLVLGRLVLSKADSAAATAVLSTIPSCSIRGSCPGAPPSDCLAVAAHPSLQHLQQLRLQLALPHVTQTCHRWMEHITTLQLLTQLTSLQVQLTAQAPASVGIRSSPQQQQQFLVQLLAAVGHLVQCKQVTLNFDQATSLRFRVAQPAAAAVEAAAMPLQAQHSFGPGLVLDASAFQPLAQLTYLQELAICTPVRLQDTALAFVAYLTKLTALSITCSTSSYGGGQTAAWGLNNDGSSSSDSGARSSSSVVQLLGPVLPQLQRLCLRGYLAEPGSTLQLLSGCSPGTIQQLDVYYLYNTLDATALLARLTSLQGLRFVGAGPSSAPANIEVLAKCLTKLTMLDLSNSGLGAGASAPLRQGDLSGLTGLQDLRLQGCCLKSPDLAALGQLTKLTRLDIGQQVVVLFEITPTAVSNSLSSLKRLVHLDLTGIRLGAAGTAWLQQLQGLTELRLRGCRTGAAAVSRLRAALPGLQVVDMEAMDQAEEVPLPLGLEWLLGPDYDYD